MDQSDPVPLHERFAFLTERPSVDCPAYNCPADRLIEVCRALRDDYGYDMLVDVTAVDWDVRSPRFTGIYHVLSTSAHDFIRLAADCVDDINPSLPSLCGLYPAANWHERETFDMLGIRYEGHPDLRRILMWDDYPYHPLRKDFPLAGIETEFPAADVAEVTGAKVKSAPMMGGPFVAQAHGPMSETEPRARDESWTERREKPVD